MRKRTLLGIFVVLLVVGAYAVYALNNPKLPEVKGCINPFGEVKPISKTQENWSRIHVFFKAVLSKDIRGLAEPWEIDYKNVKIVKHTLDYNGEKITMLAIGLPLKDGKHVIAYYEFSKPVQGIKTRAFLLGIQNDKIKTEALTTNGIITPTTTCTHECSSDSDCGDFASCNSYCCDYNEVCLYFACVSCASACACVFVPPVSPACVAGCVTCALTICGPAIAGLCCNEEGGTCVDWGDMP